MNTLIAYLRLYVACFGKALAGISRAPWTLLLPVGIFLSLGVLRASMGRIQGAEGLILSLVFGAAGSCYLYFTGEVVANSRVSLKDFTTSIGKYFWSILNLLFVFWVVSFLLKLASPSSSTSAALTLAVVLFQAVLLNPAPEVIYLRGTYGGTETISESVRFMQENWIAWLIPNIVLFGAGFLIFTTLNSVLGGTWGAGTFISLGLTGALFDVTMVFRGHLFRELNASTHRQRLFRFKNSSSA